MLDVKTEVVQLRASTKEKEQMQRLADFFETSVSKVIIIAIDVLEQTVGGVDVEDRNH